MYTLKGRGPDNMALQKVSDRLVLGFQRLRIVDTSVAGDQPLRKGAVSVIANAEIYNFEKIKAKYGFEFESSSDCEIFLHLYEKFGSPENFINELDGVFAFILHDADKGVTYAGRDPIGVRPVFWGEDVHGNMGFASEAKALLPVCKPDTIKPFLPGHFWSSETDEVQKWYKPTYNLEPAPANYDETADLKTTAELLYASTVKRMMSDRPIGTFLSGGLDSSVVAAFIKKYHRENGMNTNLNTFSIGLEGSPDLAYSQIVADHIQSSHHHVEVHVDDCLNAIEDVVYATETFDVTTIRASTPMYLLSKYIRQNSDDIVIYSGEGSDELTQGYLYFKKQPNEVEGALESRRLMEQLYEFDVLRVDRTTAAHGLEVREPFLDKAFMQHYHNLPTNIKCPRENIEKYHLRKAISDTYPDLLPHEIVWRQKEAFSDGVSSFKKKSWVDELKDYADSVISDAEFEEERRLYHPMPMFKDALLLRRLYNKHYGTIEPQMISKYWVPQWSGDNPDSSARKLTDLFDQDAEDEKMQRDAASRIAQGISGMGMPTRKNTLT
jgi:asparagine synthase (glutamine-hydrolysing)